MQMNNAHLFLLIISCALLSLTLGDICGNTGNDFEKHLSTRTAYKVWANRTFGKIEFDGCQPVKLWMYGRHGSRYPGRELMTVMKTRLDDIRKAILARNPESTEFLRYPCLDALSAWDEDLDDGIAKQLTDEGAREWLKIATRTQSRFPDVFDKFYTNSSYKFKFTDKERAEASAKSFAKGLFGAKHARNVQYPEAEEYDPILQFFLECGKWKQDFINAALLEKTRFEGSLDVAEMVTRINQRLHLNDTELSFGDLNNMYMTCLFEAARGVESPWCTIFTIDDLKMLEYNQDVKNYWLHGYGFENNYKPACIAFNDLISTFDSTDANPKVTAYFTHTAAMLRLVALLGLYNPGIPLRADNYKQFIHQRIWKTGFINPFANNLLFILHNCGGQQKVLTMHQERIIRLPACPTSDLCDLEQIKLHYKNSLDHCTHEDICQEERV